MKNSFFSKFAKLSLALLFVSCIAFVACKQPETINNYNVSIVGTWISSFGENYVITSNSIDSSGAGYTSYAGDNLVVVMDSETSGRLFIKYTRAFCTEHSDFANGIYTYDSDAPDVGKWYAMSYKNLKDNSVSLSGAAGAKTSTDTLEEAIAEFTIEKGYFGNYSECQRKN